MKTLKRLKQQSGVSMIGILTIMALFSFFLLVVLRLAPPYMEGRSVKAAIEGVVEASDASMSLSEVNRQIVSTFITNRIDGIKDRDVKVYREKQKIIIDASYEARVPLFQGVDAVLVFDDYVFTIE